MVRPVLGRHFVDQHPHLPTATVKLATVGAPATHALWDRLENHLEERAPADMFKRFAGVRSLHG
ncbi:MAG TPA: hypothetical protein VKG25_06265 [Bryobacteraceae bacterium]|nr:hypothetical protein [Bryobacteraceae bacterium]